MVGHRGVVGEPDLLRHLDVGVFAVVNDDGERRRRNRISFVLAQLTSDDISKTLTDREREERRNQFYVRNIIKTTFPIMLYCTHTTQGTPPTVI